MPLTTNFLPSSPFLRSTADASQRAGRWGQAGLPLPCISHVLARGRDTPGCALCQPFGSCCDRWGGAVEQKGAVCRNNVTREIYSDPGDLSIFFLPVELFWFIALWWRTVTDPRDGMRPPVTLYRTCIKQEVIVSPTKTWKCTAYRLTDCRQGWKWRRRRGRRRCCSWTSMVLAAITSPTWISLPSIAML